MKLRCYVFANLVRDSSRRVLSREEILFIDSHRGECPTCRQREESSNCSLDTVRSLEDIEDEAAKKGETGSILDNLGFGTQRP